MDIVDEMTRQLGFGVPTGEPKLDIRVGTFCGQSMGWIVHAIHSVNDKEFIQKVMSSSHISEEQHLKMASRWIGGVLIVSMGLSEELDIEGEANEDEDENVAPSFLDMDIT